MPRINNANAGDEVQAVILALHDLTAFLYQRIRDLCVPNIRFGMDV